MAAHSRHSVNRLPGDPGSGVSAQTGARAPQLQRHADRVSRERWERLSAVASGQHGLVTRADLRACGVPPSTGYDWIARGLLVECHRGVFALGHERLTVAGRRLAAVLACGSPAALSHGHGAAERSIPAGKLGAIDVTIPRVRAISTIEGIKVHRSAIIGAHEATRVRGIPVCTIPWILVQLASFLDPGELERAVQAAERQRPLSSEVMHDVLTRAHNAKGIAALKAIFGLEFEERTSAEFVELYLEMCRRYDLPLPQISTHLDVGLGNLREADLLYPDAKLAIELDGAAVHLSRRSFESDRRRDAAFLAHGYATLRITWHRLTTDQRALAEEIRTILAARTPQAA